MGHFKHFFWLIIGLTILGKAYASNTALISANKVYTQSSAPSMVIIDLRSAEKYEQGHIPNAINLPLNQFHRKKGQIDGFVQTPQSFRRLMEQAGIQNRDQLILYSDWSFLDAARAYWVLDFYGHQQKQILDGGFQAWQDQALPISLTASTKPTSSYMVSVMPDKLATKLQNACRNQKWQLPHHWCSSTKTVCWRSFINQTERTHTRVHQYSLVSTTPTTQWNRWVWSYKAPNHPQYHWYLEKTAWGFAQR